MSAPQTAPACELTDAEERELTAIAARLRALGIASTDEHGIRLALEQRQPRTVFGIVCEWNEERRRREGAVAQFLIMVLFEPWHSDNPWTIQIVERRDYSPIAIGIGPTLADAEDATEANLHARARGLCDAIAMFGRP